KEGLRDYHVTGVQRCALPSCDLRKIARGIDARLDPCIPGGSAIGRKIVEAVIGIMGGAPAQMAQSVAASAHEGSERQPDMSDRAIGRASRRARGGRRAS